MTRNTPARAKLNLTLQILGRMPDGYHDLRSVMVCLELADQLSVVCEDGPPEVLLRLSGAPPDVPTDDSNLVVRAARAFLGDRPLRAVFRLAKRIPAGGGLGGGSTDAAAALRLLNLLPGLGMSSDALERLAAGLGSDVPFALRGGTALAEGRGERLTLLPSGPPLWIALVRPPLAISTPWCYRAWDEAFLDADGRVRRAALGPVDPDAALAEVTAGLAEGNPRRVAAGMFNDLQAPVLREYPHLREVPAVLRGEGCVGALMTGSGSCFFGLAESRADARQAVAAVRRRNLGRGWVTRTALVPDER